MLRITQIIAALLLVQVTYVFGASVSARITGGEDAYPGQFPYQVSVQYGVPPFIKYIPICGGSILNKQWILTSAQCLNLIPRLGKAIVKAGIHDLDKEGEWVQTSEVLLRLVHKNYRGILRRIRPYDIGLLKLKTPLQLNERVQAIKLPTADTLPNGTAVVTGWGSVSTTIIPKLSDVLQVADVSIISESNCLDALRTIAPTESLTDIQFCTGPLDKTIAICIGDSGDPLVQVNETDNTTIQIGIASWAPFPCGSTGSPTVYTLVSAFISWIEQRIAENS